MPFRSGRGFAQAFPLHHRRVTGWQRARATGDNGGMNNENLPTEFPHALDELWAHCVGMIARGIDYPHYVDGT